MATYNVFLGDVNSELDQNAKTHIKTSLQSWFTQITENMSQLSASVTWTDRIPTIQPNELLVYFVPSSINSIIGGMPGSPNGVTSSYGGITVFTDSLSASEVDVSQNPNSLAEIAFHELMHNKLHMNDAQLHSHNGLARIPIHSGTRPSPENIRSMRNRLRRNQPQWTGGWTAANDPAIGLF